MSFNITVSAKPSNHPFAGRGSQYCYYVDGVPGKQLDLAPGTSYEFHIDTPGHPFYFTTSESGGSEDKQALPGFTPTDRGTVKFTMPDSYPNKFYYQCRIHPYMGGVVNKSHHTFYVTTLINGLVAPTSLAAPNGSSDIYVADQIGIVYKCQTNTKAISIFLDVREHIPELNLNYDERGLLGLCFHPQFNTNGRFYIYYSSIREYTGEVSKGYYNCLSEFTYQNGRVLTEAEKVILRINRDLPFHNAGKIGFGPDGYLYVTIGDGGPEKDPNNNAQDLGLWLGKILRIDVNVTNYPFYRVPPDNPFVNVKGVRPEIWAYGLRNPWGLEFSGNVLIVTDAGQDSGTGQEEVNIIVKGKNYGWNIKEGSNLATWNTKSKTANTSHMIDPIFAYTTSDPNYADSDVSVIVGGYLTGQGDYICADFSGRLIRLRFNQNTAQVVETGSLSKWIRSFGKVTDANGTSQLYVLTSEVQGPSGTTGQILALTVS